MRLRLGLPSKGRMMEQCFDWFGARGVALGLSGEAREYAAAADAAELEVVLMAASEVPRELAAGRLHAGVTGTDLVRETLPDWEAQVGEWARLGFGQADLVIAVPRAWIDVDGLDDLDAAAAAFRRAHGFRLRIATKYRRLVHDFLRAGGVADYQLVDSQGATEAAVRNGLAEAVADITSTGETLRANHLKVLSDGRVLQSEATLFLARSASWPEAARAALGRLASRLGLPPPAV